MMPLADALQRELGDAYRIERELGGGGMSRVFVAEEVALGRRVAIKVLPPELADGIAAERFRREIELAARLQHPHIVPLLRAGRAAGLVFYVMPYVQGETLRARIARTGAVPPAEAGRLARDVAEALAYAHANGVVHRDIKPENILLSSGHALVLDFGVAKALRQATEHGGGTTAGVALGTPLYMSPEQAAGGGDVDGRADLYALGVVLYEMLAGRPPFESGSAYELMGAHIADTPPPLRRRSAETPPALETVVMRCLAKRPADRFQRADELAVALEGVGASTGRPATRMPPRFPAIAAGIGGAALLAAAAALYAVGGLGPRSLVAEGALGQREPVLLADFENHTPDSTLGVAVTEAFRLDLIQSPAVAVMAPSQVQQALERMRADPQAPLPFETARELARREGIKAVIGGDITALGSSYVVAARIVNAETGEVLAGFRETARDDRAIITAVDRVSKQLRRRVGESVRGLERAGSLERVTTGSIEALALYSQGIRAGNAGRHEQAAALMERAVAVDTAFASAYRGLAVAYANLETSPGRMMDAFTRAFELRDRLPERERYLAEASFHTEVEYRPERAIAAYEAVLQRYPTDRTALNNLGLLYLDRGNPAKALALYRRNVTAHPSTLSRGNLLLAEYQRGSERAADSILAAWGREVPDDIGLLPYQLNLLLARRRYDSAHALASRLLDGVGEEAAWYVETHQDLASIARIRGRIREAEAHEERAAGVAAAPAAAGDALSTLRLAVTLAAMDVKLRNRGRAGLDRIAAALSRVPMERIPPADRPYLELADVYASAGQPDLAERLLVERKRVLGAAGTGERAMLAADLHGHYTRQVQAQTLRAAGRPADAVAELLRHPERGTEFWLLPELAASYDALGRTDSAAAVYERFLTTRWLRRAAADGWHRPRILFRLGEIYEQRGDRARAADYYSQFAELWRGADPDLQPQVAEARRRLAALTAEPGRQ
jgi:tRNA A-37 threonylcarbamoyl transferase component Bud32/tetratricopeptide (TPR) repeat protein